MRTLYICYHYSEEHGDNTLVINDDMKLETVIHCNDGEWRGEYFNDMFENYGVKIVEEFPGTDEELEKYLTDFYG